MSAVIYRTLNRDGEVVDWALPNNSKAIEKRFDLLSTRVAMEVDSPPTPSLETTREHEQEQPEQPANRLARNQIATRYGPIGGRVPIRVVLFLENHLPSEPEQVPPAWHEPDLTASLPAFATHIGAEGISSCYGSKCCTTYPTLAREIPLLHLQRNA
jgi:hypothetical protein